MNDDSKWIGYAVYSGPTCTLFSGDILRVYETAEGYLLTQIDRKDVDGMDTIPFKRGKEDVDGQPEGISFNIQLSERREGKHPRDKFKIDPYTLVVEESELEMVDDYTKEKKE
jgi:hypothetical protein